LSQVCVLIDTNPPSTGFTRLKTPSYSAFSAIAPNSIRGILNNKPTTYAIELVVVYVILLQSIGWHTDEISKRQPSRDAKVDTHAELCGIEQGTFLKVESGRFLVLGFGNGRWIATYYGWLRPWTNSSTPHEICLL
jgi:hypothetical protein